LSFSQIPPKYKFREGSEYFIFVRMTLFRRGARCIIFPGQGSQHVGMGKDIASEFRVAKKVFHDVDESLGCSLSSIMFEDQSDQLRMTEWTQVMLNY
jgi:acyl transferase domain-containing protein